MKQNIWKTLALLFFTISLIGFVMGYIYLKEYESKIKSLQKRLDNPTIEMLVTYLQKKDKRIGSGDKPFIKKYTKDPYLFTFVACLNPPACNQTEIEVYKYLGDGKFEKQ